MDGNGRIGRLLISLLLVNWVRTSALLPRLADALFDSPAVTVPQVQQILGVTHRSANLAVAHLVDEGILHPLEGRLRNRQFVAQDILDAVDERTL